MKKFTGDQRTRLTRMLIRKAFLELLGQKPIQTISIRELCERAGVSRGTYYSHYTDIYDLLHQIEDDMLRELTQALQQAVQASGDDSPAAVSTRIFEILKENSDFCTVTLGDYGDKEFTARLVAMGRDICIDRYRTLFQNVPARQLDYYYAFVSAGIIGLLRAWLADGMSATPAQLSAMAEAIMLHGLDAFRQA